ncbi:uncharacterized protein LOC122300028 isoform X1 [Carya illinoinensis]|uniref:Uncharacterized protein n=1 Tax=Carya illinoinensis TaxID=32201 RepID=A0A8T1RAS3_CARIL|nr:uncharacterized protein LOC122300028 isoform X1 [Carya illinoinensis]KAG6663709.1 hypothetical protein CIPAW_02G042400 [Carya illinoinensis]
MVPFSITVGSLGLGLIWVPIFFLRQEKWNIGFSHAKVRMKSRLLISSSTACTAVVPGSYGRSFGGSCPYTISKGVNPVEDCSEVLYVHSAKASQLAQSLGLSLVKHLRALPQKCSCVKTQVFKCNDGLPRATFLIVIY